FGFLYLQQALSDSHWRRGLFVVVIVAIAVECGSAPMRLTDVPRKVPDIYRFLRAAPDGVVLELPIEDWNLAPDYMFWSTFHSHPRVNGYSGYEPPDYVDTLKRLEDFPDDHAIERLRDLNVRYVVVHQTYYRQQDFSAMMVDILKQPALIPSG